MSSDAIPWAAVTLPRSAPAADFAAVFFSSRLDERAWR